MTHEEKIEGELTGISHRLAAIEKAKQFYVYVLYDPRLGKNMRPIYVGKGHDGRAQMHWNQAEDHRNPLLRAVFCKIRAIGLKPIVEIVDYFNIEANAFRREVELIAQYGRRDLKTGTLCNLTDGGEGMVGNLANADRMRRLMHKLHADPEWAKARDKRLRKLHADLEFAAARNERARKQICKLNADPEFVKAKAERSRKCLHKLHTNPEFTAACSERIRKYNADPEFAKALAKNMRELNADPDFAKAHAERGRKRMLKLNADPDFANAKAERIRKLNADPNHQAKAAAGLATYWAKRRAHGQ